MEGLLSVSIGTVAWATISFLIVLFLLRKLAWGPIVQSLKEREEGIANAIREADRAREEMARLQAGNEELLRQAREERDVILREAKAVGEKMRTEAQQRAQNEADRMISSARQEIDNQKKAAIADLKNQVAQLSIEIAEKLVREKLSDGDRQKALNQALTGEFSKN
ncbi:MAG: F0F1 ATP synthase subunit B [Flavobacteriales bacterium]|jgi:F-type H+-transporting ATPase subunit b